MLARHNVALLNKLIVYKNCKIHTAYRSKLKQTTKLPVVLVEKGLSQFHIMVLLVEGENFASY